MDPHHHSAPLDTSTSIAMCPIATATGANMGAATGVGLVARLAPRDEVVARLRRGRWLRLEGDALLMMVGAGFRIWHPSVDLLPRARRRLVSDGQAMLALLHSCARVRGAQHRQGCLSHGRKGPPVSADGSGLRPAQHVSSVGSRRGEGWVYDFAHEADILGVELSGGDRVLTADSQEGGHTFEVLQRMLRRSVRGRLRNGYCVVSYAEALSVVKDTMLRPMLM